MGGALTFNVSEMGITAYEWARGRATAEQFGESLGGVAMSAAGLKGLGRLGAQLGKSVSGLGTRAATLSMLRQVGGVALDTALPVVGRAGLGVGRAGLGLTGQGLGAAVRGLSRSGNEGGRTTALGRLVHNADGTHNNSFVGRQAQRLAEWTGTKACFVMGSPIEGQFGAKPIEEYRSYEEYGDDCDVLVSRSELNDDAPLVLRRVLRKFERLAVVVELTVKDHVIGTTGEHPIFVRGKGWTKANEFRAGDEVRLMAPGWLKVERVEVTNRVETVYNLEIEEDHTYFVGCADWGFSVWAHNAYDPAEYGPHALAWTDINLRPNRKFAIERGENPSPLGAGMNEAHVLSARNPAINRNANHLFVVDENGKVIIREFQGPQDRGPHSGLLPADQHSQMARVAGELHIGNDGAVSVNLKSGHFMRDNRLTQIEIIRFQELMKAEIVSAGFRVGTIHSGIQPVW